MELPRASYPKHRVTHAGQLYNYSLAGLFIIMAVAQLMTFEKFVPIMQNYLLFGNMSAGRVAASLIVVSEIMTLPFLLRMRVSPLMRVLSASLLPINAFLWVGLGIWALQYHSPLTGTGILGSFFSHGEPPITVLFFGVVICGISGVALYILRRDVKLQR